MREEKLYTMKEISMASGIDTKILQFRRRRRKIPAGKGGYTLEEAKQMIKRPVFRPASEKNAKELRARLLNDGAL